MEVREEDRAQLGWHQEGLWPTPLCSPAGLASLGVPEVTHFPHFPLSFKTKQNVDQHPLFVWGGIRERGKRLCGFVLKNKTALCRLRAKTKAKVEAEASRPGARVRVREGVFQDESEEGVVAPEQPAGPGGSKPLASPLTWGGGLGSAGDPAEGEIFCVWNPETPLAGRNKETCRHHEPHSLTICVGCPGPRPGSTGASSQPAEKMITFRGCLGLNPGSQGS